MYVLIIYCMISLIMWQKSILGHQSVPLSRVSVETELEITAHLKVSLEN